MSDILDDYRVRQASRPERVQTHYIGCHMHHDECMTARMAAEITRLRGDAEVARLRLEAAQGEIARLRLTDEERATLHYLRTWLRHIPEVDALLARLGGDA